MRLSGLEGRFQNRALDGDALNSGFDLGVERPRVGVEPQPQVTEMTLICAETRLRLPDLDLDLLADPISVTTRSNPMRQVRSGPGTEPVWESLSSPAELADICQ